MNKKFILFTVLTLIPTTSFCMEKKDKEKEPLLKKEISFEEFILKAEDAYKTGAEYYAINEFEEAFKYIKFAGEKNHLEAQFVLATMLFEGKGCEKNLSEAMKYCSIALKKGKKEAEPLWYEIVTEFVKKYGTPNNQMQLVLDPSMLGGAKEDDDDEDNDTSSKKSKHKTPSYIG